MNSQKKQSAKQGGAIKTDKYGIPLNFGNYKNGRLVTKKKTTNKGNASNNRSDSKKKGGAGRGGNNPPPGSRSKNSNNNAQSQKKAARATQKNEERRGELASAASVGLTGAAHNVIKEALLESAPTLAALTASNASKEEEETTTNSNTTRSSSSKSTRTPKQFSRNRRSVPDLVPPPTIQAGNDPLHMGPMAKQRRDLPVYKFKDELLKTIANNRVTVVEGETGSGKTTQVPQFILEDAAARNVPCNIIIAQPRRISAMSVAERVAAERGDRIGTTVGYTIRLESKATANTRLLFCTTGILLKRLEEDATLENVTHVFVDEVHERSIESDFLLMVLRDMLPKRPVDAPLKVILMSATLDASLFHDYFWDAPSVKFPGRTFPVTELYLEDALEVTQHVVRGHEDWCHKGKKTGASHGGASSAPPPQNRNNKYKGRDASEVVLLEDKDDMLLNPDELTARYDKYSLMTQTALAKLDPEAINYSLVVDTIQWLSNLSSPLDAANCINGNAASSKKHQQLSQQPTTHDTTSSAILVFLPGIKEITTVQELLVKSLKGAARDWVLPIHSSIPPEEQRLVFTRPPTGIRKIVLATNIAETAITIDDVAFVVDTGRMKENRYDPLKRMSSLEDCLVARSNARQRRGRAGRVRAGVAVHLFSKHRHDKIAMAAQAPEVQRVPLEQLVLRIKALKYPGTAAEVCARLVEPPAPHAVQRAVDELVFLEAMTIDGKSRSEELTALGVHLSTLPVDCRIGKLILLGAMFGVTDDALTIAATLSYRNPFQSPMAKRDEADRAKMSFATAQSDHLTVLNAYKQVDKMSNATRFDFCRENFLSIKTMQTIAGLKRQFLELLSAAGFVRPNLRSRAVESLGRRNGGCDGVALALARGLEGSGFGRNKATGDSSDWKCTKCNINNFARNTRACFKCKALKPKVVEAPAKDLDLVDVVLEERILLNGDEDEEVEENSIPLLKALLVAALFPQMVMVEESKSKKGRGGGMALKAKIEGGEKQEDIALHPSCITGKSKGALSSKYLVYHEMVKTTRVYIRDATPVSPYALLLFGGGRINVEECPRGSNESVLRLDGWLGFKCQRKDHLLVMELREVLDSILRHKVENPKKDFTEEAEGIIDAVKAILTMDEDGKAMAPEKPERKPQNNTVAKGNKNTGKGGGRGRGSKQRRR
ncbi:hypothetical protein ACHAXR_010081 [Thalassiosira sp. AJA248-18]